MLVQATCPLCDKIVSVEVPPGYKAELDHYNNDKVIIKPRVISI